MKLIKFTTLKSNLYYIYYIFILNVKSISEVKK